jgi:hypothetical protein
MRIEGLDGLMKILDRFAEPKALADTLRPALAAAGEEVRSHLVRYPGKPSYPLRWASARQRFYVLYILRRGLGPYQRGTDPMSQRLQASWTVDTRRDFSAVVGTRVTYAPYVQSRLYQQPFHRATGWVTDEEAVQRTTESGALREHLLSVVRKAMEG